MFKLTGISIAIFIATILNIFTAYTSWQRRRTKGGMYFALATLALVFWTLFAGLDYAAVPVSLKVFFAKLEALGYVSAIPLMTTYTIIYAGRERWLKVLPVRLWLVFVPLSSLLLIWTNDLHGWVWTGWTLSDIADNVLIFEHGPAFIWITVSGYSFILVMFVNLLLASFTGTTLSQKQARLLLLALAVPVASNAIYLSNISNTPGVDWSSITFSVTGLFFLLALYGSRFLDIAPIARNTMIEDMSDGILVLDDKGYLVDFNPAAQAIFRIQKKDLWTPFQTVLAPWPEIVSLLEFPAASATKEISIGSPPRVFEMHLTQLGDQRGNAYGQLMAFRDITERKRMEQALSQRNNILATLFQTSLDLVNRRDVDDLLDTFLLKISQLLDASDMTFDLLEADDRLVTHTVFPNQSVIVKDVLLRGRDGLLRWQVIENGEPIILEDYSAIFNRPPFYRNTDFPVHAILILPIKLNNRVIGTFNLSRREPGKPFRENDVYIASQLIQMVALILDNSQVYARLQHELAERKQVEEALRISRENFMGYFNMGAVGVCVTSPEKGWIEVNDRLCQMLDYSVEELKQRTWEELTHPDDLKADLTLFDRVLRGEIDSYHLDKRFIRRDGGILHTSMYISCQRYSSGEVRYLLASLVDITERAQQEQALHQAQEQVLEQQRSLAIIEERQRMARDLHDSVSQSLHGLNLFSETLTAALSKNNSERAMQLAERLQESARQALKEARLMLFQLQSSSDGVVVDLLRDIETRLSTVERRAGVRASFVVEGSLDDFPDLWSENLYRIVIEALNNALKYAQAREVVVSLNCFPPTLELTVTDNGIGFDLTRVRAGGMGLRSMRERVELLGGTIQILSEPEKGSTVMVHIPMKDKP